MHDIGLSDVKAAITAKGYHLITAEGQPNIIGIRNASPTVNAFNDVCWVWWTEKGVETVHNYTITTDPGLYYLQNPIKNTNGTAILVPGQYVGCWELGVHRGKQFALCQRTGEVSVYRDVNRDAKLDFNPDTITKGYFGIDLHNAGLADPLIVGVWSAGCQVWEYHAPHEALMNDFEGLSERNHFTRFSYTLLNQSDFS